MTHLSVVIPCFNELANLEHGVLDEVEAFLVEADYTWEVVVVDDASTDGSGDFVRRFCAARRGFRMVSIPHGGKPAAVWAGIQESVGELVLFTDMDQSTPIEEWTKLRPHFSDGYDVVIGSRGGGRDGFSLLRRGGSEVFRSVRRAMILSNIRDTQCGFKACRRVAAMQCFPRLQYFRSEQRPRGWKVTAYDVELLFLFERAGYRIAEVPVRWSNRDRSETKDTVRFQYLHESQEMLREIVRVKVNAMRGMYD